MGESVGEEGTLPTTDTSSGTASMKHTTTQGLAQVNRFLISSTECSICCRPGPRQAMGSSFKSGNEGLKCKAPCHHRAQGLEPGDGPQRSQRPQRPQRPEPRA